MRFGWIIAPCVLLGCNGIFGVDAYGDGATSGETGAGATAGSPNNASNTTTGGGNSAGNGGAGASSEGGFGGAGAQGGAPGGAGGQGGSGPVSWNAYDYENGAWTATPLDQLSTWSLPNAPPKTGIIAALRLKSVDRILIFADDGMLYRFRNGSTWMTPAPVSSVFSSLPNHTIRGAYHVPVEWTPANNNNEAITIIANPQYSIYEYKGNDAVEFVSGQLPIPQEPGCPDRTQVTELFEFEWTNLNSYYDFYWAYSDGRLYRYTPGVGCVTNTTIGSSTFWQTDGFKPPTSGLSAAYFDIDDNRIRIFGP